MFDELYTAFTDLVYDNQDILSRYASKHLTSMEATALLFSECIIEDVDMVLCLKKAGANHRYSDGIIRNICEQVIEFIYLYNNQNLLPEYYALDRETIDDTDLIGAVRRLAGDKRYTSGRNISDMARNIGEIADGADGSLSLYGAYQLISTVYHNSYREHFNDLIGEAEGGESKDDNLDDLILTTIITKFMEVYGKIIDNLNY